MKKKLISILILSILILSFIGTTTVTAQGYVKISGTILGSFKHNCCGDDCDGDDDGDCDDDNETNTIPLSNVKIIISEIGDDCEIFSSYNTTSNSEGYYEVEVLKGGLFKAKTYTIMILPTKMVIDGKICIFHKQIKTVQVKLRDVTLNFEIIGKTGINSYENIYNPIILDILNNIFMNLKIKLQGLF